ncbi:MAG: iron ABC transporter permease [Caulobacterales bacterium]|nr:iron ABC transporter permease [Caulobacterales bacterium]MCA0371367.1 iron ABC transporter permease [Pseudomonadota bacterium]
MRNKSKNINLNLFLFVLLLFICALSLMAGKVFVPLNEWMSGDLKSLIIMELRLPRAIIGVLIGAGLGMSGAVMQGYLRNPLADPGLFGVSSSAALGAVISMFFGYAIQPFLLPTFALLGAGFGMLALTLLAGRSASLVLFTLSGVIISSLTASLTALFISLAPNPFAASEIVTWLMGALSDRSWDDVKIALPLIIIGVAFLLSIAKNLDALSLGEASAKSMGVNLQALQYFIIIGIGLCVGASVAVSGIIGFVGLVVPHLVRPFVGHRPSSMLIPSALLGAILVVSGDCLVRIMPTQSELRLGIAMSLLGAPFFLGLLFKMRREIV